MYNKLIINYYTIILHTYRWKNLEIFYFDMPKTILIARDPEILYMIDDK